MRLRTRRNCHLSSGEVRPVQARVKLTSVNGVCEDDVEELKPLISGNAVDWVGVALGTDEGWLFGTEVP